MKYLTILPLVVAFAAQCEAAVVSGSISRNLQNVVNYNTGQPIPDASGRFFQPGDTATISYTVDADVSVSATGSWNVALLNHMLTYDVSVTRGGTSIYSWSLPAPDYTGAVYYSNSQLSSYETFGFQSANIFMSNWTLQLPSAGAERVGEFNVGYFGMGSSLFGSYTNPGTINFASFINNGDDLAGFEQSIQIVVTENGTNPLDPFDSGTTRTRYMFTLPAPVPEPATASLLLVGAAGVVLRRRR